MFRNRLIAVTAIVVLALGLATSAALAGPLDGAKKALEKGDYEKAAKAYLKVCKKDNPQREAVLGLAEATTKGALDDDFLFEAEEALGVVLDGNDQDLGARMLLAEVYLLKASRQRDPQMLRGYYSDARENFGRVLAKKPKDQQAATGVAKSLYYQGDFVGAEDALDTYLSQRPADTALAEYWRGKIIYVQASDAYKSAGKMTDDVRKLYVEAQGAFAASTAEDPSSYDAWIELAWAAHYAGNASIAHDGYVGAVKADTKGASENPLKGLASLHAHKPAKYTETLTELAAAYPKHEHVLLYSAADSMGRKDNKAALDMISKYVKVARNPAPGYFLQGQISERNERWNDAQGSYRKALETRPDFHDAAWAWSQLLINNRNLGQKLATYTKSDVNELIKAFKTLFKHAPKNVYVRNSMGFALREFYGRHAGQADWLSVLEESTKAYVSASEIIGEYDPGFSNTMYFGKRYGYAQIISDTGLMLQFYPQTRDLEKAEAYYLSALEWSDSGYFDAWNNLRKIYENQERWDDLYDLASLCADGLVRESGAPHGEGRAQAKGVMERLISSGKVTDN